MKTTAIVTLYVVLISAFVWCLVDAVNNPLFLAPAALVFVLYCGVVYLDSRWRPY